MNNLKQFIVSTIKDEIFNTIKKPSADNIASKVSFFISEMANELGDDWEDYYAQIGIKEFKDQWDGEEIDQDFLKLTEDRLKFHIQAIPLILNEHLKELIETEVNGIINSCADKLYEGLENEGAFSSLLEGIKEAANIESFETITEDEIEQIKIGFCEYVSPVLREATLKNSNLIITVGSDETIDGILQERIPEITTLTEKITKAQIHKAYYESIISYSKSILDSYAENFSIMSDHLSNDLDSVTNNWDNNELSEMGKLIPDFFSEKDESDAPNYNNNSIHTDELQDQIKQLKNLGLLSEDEKEGLSAENIKLLSTINKNPTAKGLSELCNVSSEEIIDQIYMINGLTIRSEDQKVEKRKLFDVLAQIKSNSIKGIKLIIDGMNICYVGESSFSLKCLLSLILVIIERDGEFECIFDSTVKKRFKEKNPDECRYIDQLFCEVGEFFRVCPSGEEADELILKLACKKHNMIISNDNYEDYKLYFPWVGRGSPRLKKVEISEDDNSKKKYIEVKELNIRTIVREDLKNMVFEIIAKLK